MLDIIVNIGQLSINPSWPGDALALARRLRAFVTGLQVVAVSPSLMAIPDVIRSLAAEEQEALGRQDWWREQCRHAGIDGEWEVIRGISARALAKRSRLTDFVIGELKVGDPDAALGFDDATRALFARASPMLLVPDLWHEGLQADRIVIAWNGSGEAAQAVKAALPLLLQASAVQVLDGERSGLPGISPPPLPLRPWFARHGIDVHNIAPTLDDKADIVRNAIDLAHVIGVAEPKVAILAAVETVNARMPSTLDAAALCKMADRGQITGALLDGPLAFNNAVSAEAARIKGIVSAVAGQADILVVPDLESGNMLAKQLEYMGHADSAGIVMGARVPIVLTSRSDSRRSRLASCAIALLLAHHYRTSPP
ncbi:bifunctional enoyl-CoA hydratase/phosphate acetyltransferase [Rhodanobacter lindaniclasticus]